MSTGYRHPDLPIDQQLALTVFPGHRYLDWPVADPDVRPIRDGVRTLLDDMEIATHA